MAGYLSLQSYTRVSGVKPGSAPSSSAGLSSVSLPHDGWHTPAAEARAALIGAAPSVRDSSYRSAQERPTFKGGISGDPAGAPNSSAAPRRLPWMARKGDGVNREDSSAPVLARGMSWRRRGYGNAHELQQRRGIGSP